MKHYLAGALICLCSAVSFAAEPIKRGESVIVTDCKTIANTSAIEFFSVAASSNIRNGQQEIWIQSLDFSFSTNTIRISSFAATADGQGFPIAGYAPFKFFAGPNVKLFIRRTSDRYPAAPTVCVGSLR